MPELTIIYDILAYLFPFEFMKISFMQRALLGLLLIAPMAAVMGIQVVNFKMAFFADAIGHSAFTGVALGLILGISPQWTMPAFGLFVGFSIMWSQRKSTLANDTIIGVFFSGVVAFGIAVVSRNSHVARDVQTFLYGDILTITDQDIWFILLLFFILFIFQFFAYNRLMYLGLNSTLAEVHGVKVSVYQFIFAGLLSLVVIFSVWAVGVLLVTALLIIPAASARNFANSSGQMFWYAIIISIVSAILGLFISTISSINTATGATVVLVSFIWYIISAIYARFLGQ
ncbi:MAG: metal ABC transporter permease [Lentisphaeria bacterium]|nr:metal ABC transporter permease [Lentisphaeria bacterium]